MAKVSCSPSNHTHALTLQSTCQMILAPGGGGIYKMMVENRTMNYPPTQKKNSWIFKALTGKRLIGVKMLYSNSVKNESTNHCFLLHVM